MNRIKDLLPNSLIVILSILFCISLYKNISYPLIWNDESDTVMAAEKILEFGYPKVHDGRNIIFLPGKPEWPGYKKESDANILMTWGSYYFATIGVLLAKLTNDIYVKTALLRIPFATIGLVGIFIFLLAFRKLFPDKFSYKIFIILFFVIEFLSVSTMLNLKEARYYSLVVFICALFLNVSLDHLILNRLNFKKYILFMVLILWFAYNINIPAFIILSGTLGVFAGISMIGELTRNFFSKGKKLIEEGPVSQEQAVKRDRTETPGKEGVGWREIKPILTKYIIWVSPVFIVFVLLIPEMIYYETFEAVNRVKEIGSRSSQKYDVIYTYFTKLEMTYTALFLKSILLAGGLFLRVKLRSKDSAISHSEGLRSRLQNCFNQEKASFFILLLIIVYLYFNFKLPHVYVRYLVAAQILMVLMMVLDLFIIFNYISLLIPAQKSRYLKIIFGLMFISVFSVNAQNKIPYLKGHIYEKFHQRKGPLDYTIPYILQKYPNPENLVIATDYEELCYVYYLNCRVLLGNLVYKNLEEALKESPDILIYRKRWKHNPDPFNHFLKKAQYSELLFPVYDSPVNNITELDWIPDFNHLFKTKLAQNDKEKVKIYVKVNP